MSRKLDDQVAVVTGAARGIGLAVARELATNGAHVHLVDIDADQARAAAEGLVADGLAATGHGADVSDEAAVAGLFAAIGEVSILVNNAGIVRAGMLWNLSLADWNAVLGVNLTSQFLTIREVTPGMRARGGGAIVNLSSVAGITGAAGQINYIAAKAGVIGVTKAAALELAKYKIRVNAIAPGTIHTDMTQVVVDDDRLRAKWIDTIPLGRIGTTDEIARTAVFLASEDASFMTGQVLVVDGGANT
jgi:3-oxoacyl-[acyl-carrier protein] reductase